MDSNHKAEIFLYGYIGDEINAVDFLRQLRSLEISTPKISVRINSRGGEMFEGFPIYNAIKSSKATIEVYVDGLAASMASAIMMAGSRVYAASNSRIMIHGPQGGDHTTAENLQVIVDMIKTLRSDLAKIYAMKTGRSEQWIMDNWLMDGKDHWFTAQEAKDVGLVDEIYAVAPESSTPEASWSLKRIAAFYNASLRSGSMSLQDEFEMRAYAGTLETLKSKDYQHFQAVYKAGTGADYKREASGARRSFSQPVVEDNLLKAEFDRHIINDTLGDLRKDDFEHFKKVYQAGIGKEYRGAV